MPPDVVPARMPPLALVPLPPPPLPAAVALLMNDDGDR